MGKDIGKELQVVIRNILKDIGVEVMDEIDQNFERESFFGEAWARRRSPIRKDRQLLADSGALRKSIKKEVKETSVSFSTDLVYAGIHNDGGEITVTDKMKRYFRRKFYEKAGIKRKGDSDGGGRRKTLSDGGFYAWTEKMRLSEEAEFWRLMAMMKVGSKIRIPRRRFIGVSPELEQAVTEIIQENLEEYFSSIKF